MLGVVIASSFLSSGLELLDREATCMNHHPPYVANDLWSCPMLIKLLLADMETSYSAIVWCCAERTFWKCDDQAITCMEGRMTHFEAGLEHLSQISDNSITSLEKTHCQFWERKKERHIICHVLEEPKRRSGILLSTVQFWFYLFINLNPLNIHILL